MRGATISRDSVHGSDVQVLTNSPLLRHISSFQSGLPLALYHFWLAHNPQSKPAPRDNKRPRTEDGDAVFSEPAPKRNSSTLSSFTAQASLSFTSPFTTAHGSSPFSFPLASQPISKPLLSTQGMRDLVSLVIKYGTLDLLKLLPQIRLWLEPPSRFCPSTLPDRWITADLSGSGVVQLIMEHNRAEMLEWGLTSGLLQNEPSFLWLKAIQFYRKSDLRLLNVVLASIPNAETELRQLFNGDLSANSIADSRLFEWLHENVPGVVTASELIAVAVDRGDLALMQHLCEQHGDQVRDPRLFGRAFDRSHLQIMAYLLEKRSDLVDLVDVRRVLLLGSPSNVRVVRESKRFVGFVEALVAQETASPDTNKKVELLAHLCNNDLIPRVVRVSIDPIAASGNWGLVRMLHTKGAAVATTEAMDRAAELDQWGIVQFLHTNRTEGCTTRVMDAAASQGRLEYFKYLHRHRTEGFSSRVLELAGGSGNIDLVRYILKLSDHQGCTTRAMDFAAQRGHLDIVKLLHENRSPTCTTATAKDRVCVGHSPPQTTPSNAGFTPHPFKLVIQNDHLEVVCFLYEHYASRFTPALLHCLLLHGAFDVWMQLRERYPHEANVVVEPVLFEAGKCLRMKTIRFIINELGREDLAYRAVDGAAEFHSARDAQWLHAVLVVTGPQSTRLSAIHAAIATSEGWVNLANLKFLVSHCSDEGAKDYAIQVAREHGHAYLVSELERWGEGHYAATFTTLHPFLLDPRASHWAIRAVISGDFHNPDPHQPYVAPPSLAVQAIQQNDLLMLQLIHGSVPRAYAGGGFAFIDPVLSFVGARAAAIRRGSLSMLQWLVETVDLSMEPTLLKQAIEFQRYEIAAWLAVNCPGGCSEMSWDWYLKAKDPWISVDEELLGWIEASSNAMRRFLNLADLTRRLEEIRGARILNESS